MIQPLRKPHRHHAFLSFFAFFVVCSFVLGCYGPPPKNPNWSNATGAEQHERLMWQSIHNKDWKDVEHHLAPLFVGVNSAGKAMDRDAWITYWKDTSVEEFSIGEITVQTAGTDMVVTYVMNASPAQIGSGSQGMKVMSVWQQVKNGWILTATSLTPVR